MKNHKQNYTTYMDVSYSEFSHILTTAKCDKRIGTWRYGSTCMTFYLCVCKITTKIILLWLILDRTLNMRINWTLMWFNILYVTLRSLAFKNLELAAVLKNFVHA